MLFSNIAKLALTALAVLGVVNGHASGAFVKENIGRDIGRVGFGHTHVTAASIKHLAARYEGEEHGHVYITLENSAIINTSCVTFTQTVKGATSETTLRETPTTHIEPTSTEVKSTVPPTIMTPEYTQTSGNMITKTTSLATTKYTTESEATTSLYPTTTTPGFIQNPTPSQGAGYKNAVDTLLLGLGVAVLMHAAL